MEVDGSILPIRNDEPWKEATVGVLYRHDPVAYEPLPKSSPYVAVVNGLGAAYRTAGARRFYDAIRRAHWDTLTGARRVQQFRYTRYGTRDMDRCASL